MEMRNGIFCPEIEACVISRFFDGRRLATTMTDVFLVFDSLASVPLVLRFYSIRPISISQVSPRVQSKSSYLKRVGRYGTNRYTE